MEVGKARKSLRGIAQGKKVVVVEAQYVHEFERKGGVLLDASGENQVGECGHHHRRFGVTGSILELSAEMCDAAVV